MNKFTKLITAVTLTAFAGIASAVPITGSIGFTGAYTIDGTNFFDSTTITRTTNTVNGIVTGSYASEGISAGDVLTGPFADIIYNPTTTPIANLWSVGSFTFNLNNMNVDFNNGTTLVLSGGGIVSSSDAGFDDSFGTWNFTANKQGSNLTWSSSAAPEPAMVLLLATGLIGFGFARKMRKA